MITIQKIDNLVVVAVIGEFTFTDYRAFEKQVLYQPRFDGSANLVFDLRDMLDYELDVVWEDIKFTRDHGTTFHRVAVITDDEWRAWSSWLSNLFINSQVSVMSDYDKAEAWVSECASSEI